MPSNHLKCFRLVYGLSIISHANKTSKSSLPTLCVQGVYKRRTECAKKDYLKALAAYRATLVSKVRGFFLFFTLLQGETEVF